MEYNKIIVHTKSNAFEILVTLSEKKFTWIEALSYAKEYGRPWRLPTDYELEEIFKSTLLRGFISNICYWSNTQTAKDRARSQTYRNGGDFRGEWYTHPGDIKEKSE